MPDDAYNFSQTRVRLEEIVTQVRKKDVSLEKSLDLLEEGVRLANQCTELIDHADWGADTPESAAVAAAGEVDDSASAAEVADSGDAAGDASPGGMGEPDDLGDDTAEGFAPEEPESEDDSRV